MKKILLLIIILLPFENFVFAQDNKSLIDNLFHIDQMNSHNKNFALYFKTRDKSILARGEDNNYINDFPVFPDDFAYYLLKDNKTLVMISAVKSLNANFKFDIIEKKLELYPTNGKFDFIISSFAKNCGYLKFEDNYKCSFYKPLISSNLIN